MKFSDEEAAEIFLKRSELSSVDQWQKQKQVFEWIKTFGTDSFFITLHLHTIVIIEDYWHWINQPL